ncbi:M20 family metallopeptidase [Streptacidiphilus sp. P02-A3a]|uniref:M20 metallopeptidase family protein n=1 Tax=Streptacidiphilus sp. P02-A3a TaxID=2704468 RepID=UPI0015FDD6F7|nr:M20 family metallopeptidase [Streptacidiphilus sp. P02-A3a]QMU68202.1 amidohydrolase [Streptacidiphilus sp. P02-A3a]
MTTTPTLRESADLLQSELVELRRAVHREPEIGLELPLTQAKVLAALRGLPLELTLGEKLSSVTAVLRGGRPGPVVLLRGDMDALPVQETSGLPYASRFPGVMHACGHDLHVAGLVGAARLLAERRDELPGTVVFMFQPGEEGLAGARVMLDEGLLEAAGTPPVAAYALHVTAATYPRGAVAGRPGPIMAAADTLTVTLRGRGGHGSAPHSALDPIPAACEAVLALQTMVTRRFDAFDPVVVTVGTLHAGTVNNVIPGDAFFEATVRSFSPQARDRVRAESLRLVRGIAEAHGLEADAVFTDVYPPTVNNVAEAEFAADVARELLGPERVLTMPQPEAGAEDFSFVAERIPSAYFFLGACVPGLDPATAPDNHAPQAAFDDSVLADGATLLAELAIRRLAR